MELLLLILGLLLFVSLVIVHEFGHFIMARRNGVVVEEFGIGFPPKIAKIYTDKKGTEYTINLLPLGGFVRLKGEHDSDREKGTFGAASFVAKTKIMLAGVFMNLVTAWLVFSALALVGIPKLPLPNGAEQFTVASDTKIVSNKVMVGFVEPEGPAGKSRALQNGDQIISMGPVSNSTLYPITRSSDVRPTIEKLLNDGNKTIEVLLSTKEKKSVSAQIAPRSIDEVAQSISSGNPKGYVGVQPYDYTVQRSTWSAPVVGVGLIGQYASLTYKALFSSLTSLFKGNPTQASENVAGPVGIFVVLKDGASFGASYILLIIGLLSLTLAIMNTLPIPALDGGKLFVMVLFRAMKKKLTQRREEQIHGTGFVLLMMLFVVITFVDIKRFF